MLNFAFQFSFFQLQTQFCKLVGFIKILNTNHKTIHPNFKIPNISCKIIHITRFLSKIVKQKMCLDFWKLEKRFCSLCVSLNNCAMHVILVCQQLEKTDNEIKLQKNDIKRLMFHHQMSVIYISSSEDDEQQPSPSKCSVLVSALEDHRVSSFAAACASGRLWRLGRPESSTRVSVPVSCCCPARATREPATATASRARSKHSGRSWAGGSKAWVVTGADGVGSSCTLVRDVWFPAASGLVSSLTSSSRLLGPLGLWRHGFLEVC